MRKAKKPLLKILDNFLCRFIISFVKEQNMRKTVGILIFLILTGLTAHGQTVADFNVTLNKAGDGVVITGYTGKATAVKIPAKIEGMPVKEIGDKAFLSNKTITSVVIPEGVTAIGNDAFGLCSKLASVTFPDSLAIIGRNVFSWSGLTSASIPKNMKSISEGLFSNCRQLRSVTIPEGVTEIKANAFYCCVSLAELKLPSTIQTIGEQAFISCESLASVTIPDSAGAINFGKLAFAQCAKLNLASQALLKRRGYEI
jgi:hypothetical protein